VGLRRRESDICLTAHSGPTRSRAASAALVDQFEGLDQESRFRSYGARNISRGLGVIRARRSASRSTQDSHVVSWQCGCERLDEVWRLPCLGEVADGPDRERDKARCSGSFVNGHMTRRCPPGRRMLPLAKFHERIEEIRTPGGSPSGRHQSVVDRLEGTSVARCSTGR
jgi:hypothetical protein